MRVCVIYTRLGGINTFVRQRAARDSDAFANGIEIPRVTKRCRRSLLFFTFSAETLPEKYPGLFHLRAAIISSESRSTDDDDDDIIKAANKKRAVEK